MRNLSWLLTTTVLLISISGCANRQPFTHKASSEQWWHCDPKDDRRWNCDSSSTSQKSAPIESTHDELNESQDLPSKAQQTAEEVNTAIKQEPIEQPEVKVVAPAEAAKDIAVPEKALDAPTIESSYAGVEEPVNKELVSNEGNWLVQLAAFTQQNAADKFASKVNQAVTRVSTVKGKTWYRVVLGFYANKEQAQEAARNIQSEHPSIQTWVRKK